ncbi:MAG: RHS repeat-associated core domain-containing protein [Labilithrix sp.]|nr:RHS repeat-associated core domain-containing protein [Labilithrix sp.]
MFDYVYDAHGNLRTAVRAAPFETVHYVIDGQDRRIGKKYGATLVQGFLYDGPRIVAELNGLGAVVSRFVYATQSHSPDLMIKAGTTYRIVKDHLGSPLLVVNASTGAVVQTIAYDEWGNATESGTEPLPFGFAGGLWDRDTGLVRFGARDYDPSTGRWTSKDRSRFRGGFNLYAYCHDNPVNFVDRTGRYPKAAEVAAVLAAGAEAAAVGGAAIIGGGAAALAGAAFGLWCLGGNCGPGALGDSGGGPPAPDPGSGGGPGAGAAPSSGSMCGGGSGGGLPPPEPPERDCVEECAPYMKRGARYYGNDGLWHRNDKNGNARYAYYRCLGECEGSL